MAHRVESRKLWYYSQKFSKLYCLKPKNIVFYRLVSHIIFLKAKKYGVEAHWFLIYIVKSQKLWC